MADCKKYNGSTWGHSLRKLGTSTDTITTLPTVLYPTGTTATVGLKGNMSQSSTPTPQNPIQPSETGESTGNLFDWNWLVNGYHLDPQTGLPTAHSMRVSILQPIDVSQLTSAILSYESVNVETLYAMYSVLTTDNTLIRRVTSVPSGSGLDLSGGDKLYIAFYNGAPSGATAITKDNITNIMLNTGSTALPYEPYGYKLDISSADTTTPVYLGEVQSTRRIKKLVLSSSQDWRLQSINSYGIANFYFITTNDFIDNTSIISNYFTRQTTTITNTTDEGMLIALSINATVYIRIKTQTASTVQEFKDWLDGLSEEVAIWYVLAEPTTGIVNEPLRKIGDYADEVSNISIPVTAGANTLSVGTTVQPSEVTVNYKGWHPAIVHERTNGAWT